MRLRRAGSSRRRGRASIAPPTSLAAATALAVGVVLALVPSALAGKRVDSWIGSTSSGTLGAQFNNPSDVAVNETGAGGVTAGTVYVTDTANHRIQRFSATGAFQRAWGADVVQTGGTDFEICTTASQCKAGVASGGNPSDNARNGALSSPEGIAVDQDTGLVYVTDRGNSRVNVYDSAGAFQFSFGGDVDATAAGTDFEVCPAANTCKAGVPAGGAGVLGSGLGRLDISKPDSSAATGSVFVADAGNRRIAEYDLDGGFVRAWGMGVDTGAPVLEICTTASGCQAAGTPDDFSPAPVGHFTAGQPVHVAVGADGFVYAFDPAPYFFGFNTDPRIARFDANQASAGNLAAGRISGTFTGLEVDSGAGGPLLTRASSPAPVGVKQLDTPSGSPSTADTHIADSGIALRGLGAAAASDGGGRLYVASTTAGHRVYVADDDGAPPLAMTVDSPSAVGAHGATLAGTVNPGGFPVDYRFEISDDGGESWTSVKPNESIGSGTTPVPVDDTATGLDANTDYLVRIVATKGFGAGADISDEVAFKTLPIPADVSDTGVSHITATGARLAGRVKPNKLHTTYRFEYGPTSAYGNTLPFPDGSVGAGADALLVSAAIEGLAPDTTYHFRLVATNAEGVTEGPNRTFTTLPVDDCPNAALRADQGMAHLADCRAFELVSPSYKAAGIGVGYTYSGFGDLADSGFAATEADRFAVSGQYGSTLVDDGVGFVQNWAFAERDTVVGWTSHTPHRLPLTSRQITRSPSVVGATPTLERSIWRANPTGFPVFEEMATGGTWGNPGFISDWAGRWEIFGPTDPSLTDPGQADRLELVLSADGSRLVGSGHLWGLSGPGAVDSPDRPDRLAGSSVHVADVSGTPVDTLASTGDRRLVNVCTGAGPSRTAIPVRGSDGKLGAQVCPAAPDGATAHLVSRYGASLSPTRSSSNANDPLANVVSASGSRVFFMAPDPLTEVSENPGTLTCAAGTGEETACPPQLYVWQDGVDGGEPTVRWISRAEGGLFGLQDASLTGQVFFEGATPDGDKVFFRTSAPLTVDDPNGVRDGGGNPVPPPPGGVVTGDDSLTSWDLYMYDFPDDPAADIGDGELTRITGGPSGGDDCNNTQGSPTASVPVPNGRAASLRFVSDDGARIFFACQSPLTGVEPPANGTVTAPGGGATEAFPVETNIYVHDTSAVAADRWRFVARVPRATLTSPDARKLAMCASTGGYAGNALEALGGSSGLAAVGLSSLNCFQGSADGGFVSFFTPAGLVAGDDATSGDLYAYDVEADELVRLTEPAAGAVGAPYVCVSQVSPAVSCFGEAGFDSPIRRRPAPLLTVVPEPGLLGERVAFFQSRARLVPEDQNDVYDVYSWRDGELSLVTSGAADADHVLYKGIDRTATNLYVATRENLSWQDVDRVGDIYVARVGGGFPKPPPPAACSVLAGGCQGPGVGVSTPVAPKTTSLAGSPSDDNVSPGARKTLRVGKPSRKALRRATRTGRLVVAVRVSKAGKVRAVAKGRIGKRTRRVASRSVRVRKAGKARLTLRLNRAARQRLKSGRNLRLTVQVRSPGARSRSITVRLPGGKS